MSARPPGPALPIVALLAFLLLLGAIVGPARAERTRPLAAPAAPGANTTALANFSAALERLVTLVAAAGGGLLALVWTRVALSWFSNDVAKKVQAKDRARDALIGTLLFAAAVSGLVWGLAQWVVGGS